MIEVFANIENKFSYKVTSIDSNNPTCPAVGDYIVISKYDKWASRREGAQMIQYLEEYHGRVFKVTERAWFIEGGLERKSMIGLMVERVESKPMLFG